MLKSISIVIPAYNEQRHLAACLDSIARQSTQPQQVIVVDNNSTDKTRQIAERYSFVEVVAEPMQGIVHARNAGFNAATSDIIARIDADSYLPENWVAMISEYFSRQDKMTALTGGVRFYNVRLSAMVSWAYNTLVFSFNKFLIGHPSLWGSNMAIPREVWLSVRSQVCTRTGIHEDLDLSMHLFAAGIPTVYDKKIIVQARLQPTVYTNRKQLWDYLQWWPRTLRVHHKKTWVLCWVVGAALMYAITPLLGVSERVARLFGFRPVAILQEPSAE